MSQTDIRPLPDSAGVERIVQKANNRLGVVFSALYSFWVARQATLNSGSLSGGGRRDAYSLIFFNHGSSTPIQNDSTSSPDELLTAALRFGADGDKNFTGALRRAHDIMNSHWSMERHGSRIDTTCDAPADMYHRPPVVVFLSNGEGTVGEEAIYDICSSAVTQGYVGFHHEHCVSV